MWRRWRSRVSFRPMIGRWNLEVNYDRLRATSNVEETLRLEARNGNGITIA